MGNMTKWAVTYPEQNGEFEFFAPTKEELLKGIRVWKKGEENSKSYVFIHEIELDRELPRLDAFSCMYLMEMGKKYGENFVDIYRDVDMDTQDWFQAELDKLTEEFHKRAGITPETLDRYKSVNCEAIRICDAFR